MNKKVLFFLPLAAMLLCGCPKQPAAPVDPEEEEPSEVIPPYDAAIYGTESSPLSVAKLIQNVKANVKAESGKFSYYKFVAIGYINANATYDAGYSQWGNFFITDNADGTGTGFKVQRAKSPGQSYGDTLCKKDKVLISGYTEYYNGSYSFFPKDEEDVVAKNLVRGTGAFTFTNKSSDVAVTETFNASYTNMTELALHATTSKANYSVVVTVNGARLAAETDGSYKIIVRGDTAVTVDLEYTGERQDIPHSEVPYTLKVTDANSQLGTAPSTAANVVNFSVVADDPEHDTYYKQVEATFSKEVCNNPNASYHEIDIGKNGKITFKLPSGKVTKVEVCTYKYTNINVYKDNSTKDSSKVSRTSESINVPGYTEQQDPHLLTYEIPAADQGEYVTIYASEGHSISLHYIQITMAI
jgi:hypothetical protein